MEYDDGVNYHITRSLNELNMLDTVQRYGNGLDPIDDLPECYKLFLLDFDVLKLFCKHIQVMLYCMLAKVEPF